MKKSSGIEEFFNNFLAKAVKADGKVIGKDGDIIKAELSKDDRGAWVNHLVEQHLKQEIIDDPPPEFEINQQDIIKEISKREIGKIIGK